jgi:hypothetical protein
VRLGVFLAWLRGWCFEVSLGDLASGRWRRPPAPALLAGVGPGSPPPSCQRCGGCAASVATANGGLRRRAPPPSCEVMLAHPCSRSTIALGRVVWAFGRRPSFAVATEAASLSGVDEAVLVCPGTHPRAADVRMTGPPDLTHHACEEGLQPPLNSSRVVRKRNATAEQIPVPIHVVHPPNRRPVLGMRPGRGAGRTHVARIGV